MKIYKFELANSKGQFIKSLYTTVIADSLEQAQSSLLIKSRLLCISKFRKNLKLTKV